MKAKWQLAMGGLVAGLTLLWVLPGCEGTSNPDTGGVDSYFANNPMAPYPTNGAPVSSDMTVTPASAVNTFVGQMFTFTASGGLAPYRWSVTTSSGRIRSINADGSQGLYNVDVVGANTVVAWDANGNSATAEVNTSGGGVLTIAPGSATLNNNTQVISFTASGGVPPYNWTVLNGHGVLNTTTGSSVLYTRISAGDNGVTVSDSVGNSASVVITQP